MAGSDDLGLWGTERDLIFYSVHSGTWPVLQINFSASAWLIPALELPGYAPRTGYRVIEFMLGRISSLSQTDPLTTQTSDDVKTTELQKRYG